MLSSQCNENPLRAQMATLWENCFQPPSFWNEKQCRFSWELLSELWLPSWLRERGLENTGWLGCQLGQRESKVFLVSVFCKHHNIRSSLLHGDGGKAQGWMLYFVVFTSIIKYQVYFSGEFLMYLLVCQAFILDSVLTCEKMLEASAKGWWRERLCDFYHCLVRRKKNLFSCVKTEHLLCTHCSWEMESNGKRRYHRFTGIFFL